MTSEALSLTDRQALYLGTLLHDIGKLWQRGDNESRFEAHPRLSGSFVRRLLTDPRVEAVAALHHRRDLARSQVSGTERVLAEIACEADTLASGERAADASVREQRRLQSIFSGVAGAPEIRYQPIASLLPERYRFPEDAPTPLPERYAELWRAFARETEALDVADAETLLHLCRKHLWCIPSASYRTVPDVSLYEHSRVAAALAVCLYDLLRERYGGLEAARGIEDRSEPRYLLLSGDLTGIQQYIYNVAHKGALKALKGRSFFLQQILRHAAHTLLRRFDLPAANLLYASGGKFYLLAPATNAVLEGWAAVEADLQRQLLDRYDGEVGMAFGAVRLAGEDFGPGERGGYRITARWAEVGRRVEQAKRRPFAARLDASFFAPGGPYGHVITCHATGRDLCRKEELSDAIRGGLLARADADAPVRYISREQDEARRIGERLRDVSVLLETAKGELPGGFPVLDMGAFALARTAEVVHAGQPDPTRALLLNNDDFLRLPSEFVRGWTFYGGNWAIEGDFDQLAERARGVELLGALRMDVDNLGRTFRSGLGERATLSRVVQLSAMLDFFFSGYLNRLRDLRWSLEKGVNDAAGEPLADRMQIVYAGGDDLFIVGAWHVLPDVALWIRREFSRFTGEHPGLTLSAGLALFHPKMPLFKAAQLAGDAEDQAKSFRREVRDHAVEKDAISFLDIPMSWADFAYVRGWVARLCRMIEGEVEDGDRPERLHRGVLQRLQRIYGEFVDGKGERWAPWRWHAAYGLARFGRRQKRFEGDLRELAAELFMKETHTTEQDLIALLGVLARWAEFLTRTGNDHGKW